MASNAAKVSARRSSRASGKGRGPEGSTSDAIYQAAEDLFFERGYGGTSLRDIADAVGLQVGSLYNHIDSKESMLFVIMQTSLRGVLEAVADAVAEVTDPVERLECFMKATIRFYGEHARMSFIGSTELRSLPEEYREKIQDLRDQYEGRLTELLTECAEAGVQIPNIRMAAYALVAISAHVASWYRVGGSMSLDEVADGLVATYAPLAELRTESRAPGPRSRS